MSKKSKFLSNNQFLSKSRNLSKASTLSKNRNFCQTKIFFGQKIEISIKKKFCQPIFQTNRNFCQKIKICQNPHFCLKKGKKGRFSTANYFKLRLYTNMQEIQMSDILTLVSRSMSLSRPRGLIPLSRCQ